MSSTPSSPSVPARLERRQAEELGAAGFLVKNTFIDGDCPDELDDGQRPLTPSRRGSSAPPSMRGRRRHSPMLLDFVPEEVLQEGAFPERTGAPSSLGDGTEHFETTESRETSSSPERCPENDPERCPESDSHGGDRATRLPIPSRRASSRRCAAPEEVASSGLSDDESLGEMSFYSTIAPTDSSLTSDISGPHADAMVRLRDTIMRECRFLRIHGCSSRTSPRFERDRRGAEGSLMLFVAGLPWAKRAKWLVPLRWTVAMVLQRRGLHAAVNGGKLYVTDDDTNYSICVDFLPSLRGSILRSRTELSSPSSSSATHLVQSAPSIVQPR